jgi:peptidoglycan/LPS O-acetylase OafA/YrhL
MQPAFSIYLDLVRFAAACLVYLTHSSVSPIVKPPMPMSDYGHSAVIIFFVLSGFVIAHVVETKESDWRRYAAGRFARIYSVVIPALVLTLLLDTAGRLIAPEYYKLPYDHFAVRFFAALGMVNEVWFISISPFSNFPYWSIAYEFWYYVIFGVVMLAPLSARWRWGLAAVVALMLGPKIVLMMPIWLSGVLLYRWRWWQGLSLPSAIVLVVGSAVGAVLLWEDDYMHVVAGWLKPLIGDWLHHELAYSRHFLADYALCACVWFNFAGMRVVAERIAPLLLRIEAPVRWAAGLTFTLYAIHNPVLLFWATVVRPDPSGRAGWWTITALTAATVIVVGYFTEKRRHVLRRWLLDRLQRTRVPQTQTA